MNRDLRKAKVSKVIIDQPQDGCISRASGRINGWVAMHEELPPEKFEFKVGPIELLHRIMKRPDVEEAMPEYTIVGFQILFDLSHYLLYIQDRKLVIEVAIADYDPFRLQFTIKEGALGECIAAASV